MLRAQGVMLQRAAMQACRFQATRVVSARAAAALAVRVRPFSAAAPAATSNNAPKSPVASPPPGPGKAVAKPAPSATATVKPITHPDKIIKTLLAYVWPEGQPGLRARVVTAFALLLAGKVASISGPFAFKYAADALNATQMVVAAAPGTGAGAAAAAAAGSGAAAGAAKVAVDAAQSISPSAAPSTAASSTGSGGTGVVESLQSAAAEASDALNTVIAGGVDTSKVALVIPLTALLGYGLARASASAFQELRNAVFAIVAQRAIRLVSTDVFKHLHALDLQFHLERQTGALTRVVDRGAKSINSVMTMLVFNVVPTALEMALVAGIFWVQCGWEYSAVTLATMGAYVWYTVGVTTWRTAIRRHLIKLENDASALAVDSLLNYETVKYYNGEAREVAKYSAHQARIDAAAIKTQSSLSILNFGQNAIFSAGLTACMLLASRGIVAGEMTVGDLILVNGLLFQLSIPLNFVGMVYREVRQGLVDMGEMFGLLATRPRIADAPGAAQLLVPSYYKAYDEWAAAKAAAAAATAGAGADAGAGAGGAGRGASASGAAAASPAPAAHAASTADGDASSDSGVDASLVNAAPAISFRNVRFRYTPDRPILRGLSFDVQPGTTVAFVGPSGCGKSTVLRLMYRMYDVGAPPPPAAGAAAAAAAAAQDGAAADSAADGEADGGVFVFGQDVRTVTLDSLRRRIGVVPQDTVLFNDSLAANIAYGREGASRGEVEAAAGAAHLHHTISSFPKGYETVVGERGLKLSGGEKQRVSLARVLLKNAPILLCDEATSSLDTETEAAVMEALYNDKQLQPHQQPAATSAVVSVPLPRRTTVLVAHRLSTVRAADTIFVMDKGIIVERGTHDELVGNPGGLYARMWAQQQRQEQQAAARKAGGAASGGAEGAAAAAKPAAPAAA